MEKLEMNCLFVVKSFLDKLNFWQKEKQSIWSEYLHIEKAKIVVHISYFQVGCIISWAGPTASGPALISNNIHLIESQKSSRETLLYNWREQQQNWASLFIVGSPGWFYQALSQLSAFLHFNYQSKFLFCLFLHFHQPNLLYIYFMYKYIDIYICVMTIHIHHIMYFVQTGPNCRLFSDENSTFFYLNWNRIV